MMPMSKTAIFYKNEVVLWRGRGALFWSSVLLPLCCYIIWTISNFSIASPYTWILDLLASLVSPSKWFVVICVCLVYWIMMSHRIKFFSVIPEVRISKWSALHSVVQPNRLLHICLQSLGSGFICWCILNVLEGKYQSFTRPCTAKREETSSCLNEQHLFIVLHCFYLGALGSIIFFSSNQNLIQYPVMQQSKWGQSRNVTLMISSAKFVLNKIKYFYIIYYLFLGAFVKRWFFSFFPVHIESAERVDSIFGLFDLWLFVATFVTGTLLYFFTCMFSVMYTAYQTQPYEFVVQCNADGEENRKLADALSCDSFPLLQFQGYQDLCLLAKHSARRRSELFILSALGGHPHNWLSISSECLTTLGRFCDEVKSDNNRTMANGSVRQLSGECNGKSADITYRQTETSNQTLKSDTTENNNKTMVKESLSDRIYKEISNRKVLAHLVAPYQESSSRRLLAQAQKYIWNIEALSYIVTASYSEDKYGVVQKSLPEIITIFVTLQEEVEKMMKMASTVSRTGVESDLENALHTRLRVALKSAIYNVGTVFGQHVESLTVPQEVKRRLRQYTEYKV